MKLFFMMLIILNIFVIIPSALAIPTFTPLGDLPGGNFISTSNATSADGSVVVGSGTQNIIPDTATQWVPSSGSIIGLSFLPGGTFSQANNVSLDGSTIVGSSTTLVSGFHATQWDSSSGTVTDLGTLPGGSFSQAFGVDSDGSVIVGRSSDLGTSVYAVKWNSGSITDLGTLPGDTFSQANSVDSDGSVIVGISVGFNGIADRKAVKWDSVGTITALDLLSPSTTAQDVVAVSPDGSIAVGSSTDSIFPSPVMWDTTTLTVTSLGLLPTLPQFGVALSASDSGDIIVGRQGSFSAFTGSPLTDSVATIWDSVNGIRNLQDVLTNDFGLSAPLTGWTLLSAADISPDGNIITGIGLNPSGDFEAWVVDLDVVIIEMFCGKEITDPFWTSVTDLRGTPSSNIFSGTNGPDLIIASDNGDTINGRGGHDCIIGGLGDDTLNGARGNDEIHGGAGIDVISGNAGNDVINGNDGDDILFGNSGVDTIYGNDGMDFIQGHAGNDILFGDEGNDVIIGGAGTDEIHGGADSDTIRGGGASDTINGDDGVDVLYGESGNDFLMGDDHFDFLIGGTGTDTCDPGADASTIISCEL